MKFKPTTWLLLSIALFIAACLFWRLGDQYQERHKAEQKEKTTPRSEHQPTRVANDKKSAAPAPAVVFPENLVATGTETNLVHPASPTDYRVTNTKLSFEKLASKPSAILLRNAWIDTSAKQALNIPAELRATMDPGSYIVQSRDVINPAFRKALGEAGAAVISYIPNNAYLVTVSATGAQQLAHSPQVQSVLPFEPFYKIDMDLMPEALGQRENYLSLRVTVINGQKENALAAVKQFGGTVVGEDKTPFGPQLIVKTAPTSENIVQKLAQTASVQAIEKCDPRVLMNDLGRQRLGVSADTVTNVNWLNLTGSNVFVNVNDSGADGSHPDLINHVFGLTNDPVGHGTHVVGTILSSGLTGPSGSGWTNFGSISNANFRGMAPNASVFVLPFNADLSDNLNTFSSDAGLAETAARTNLFVFGKTNTLISNNSWGYGTRSYNSSAAIFDGAARDAIPDVPGSQPVLFIFAAGNRGGGSDVCFSADRADTVTSPATMKNGLAVGAIENLRNIGTNIINNTSLPPFGSNYHISFTCNNCTILTNDTLFQGTTDTSNQVAGFSSKGNSGINSKTIGRFKPDLVAPGTFVISTRPVGTNWDKASYYNPTNLIDGYGFDDLVIKGQTTNTFRSVIVPDNAVELRIKAKSTTPPNVPLTIFAGTSPSPSTDPTALTDTNLLVIPTPSTSCIGDRWFVEIANQTNAEVVYNMEVAVLVTNKGNVLTTLSNLNQTLDPSGLYGFESGTSMAAPAVSGVAALLEEFFEQRLNRGCSPALMKALLINGARSASSAYHLSTNPQLNQQGWGLVNLPNSISPLMDFSPTDEASWPIRFFDQSPTNALATGQSHTYTLAISNNFAKVSPLRFTLVWTDPPGNPSATINLVNDLDLIVTNLDTGDVYFGNNFSGTGDFSDVNLVSSNGVVVASTGVTNDFINNVENIYINAPLTGTNYSVTVMARRVNVNAVISNTNDIVQDYALVVSSGNNISNAFSITPAVFNVNTNPLVTYLDIGSTDNTNSITGHSSRSVVVEAEHVGANSSLIVSTNGTNTQWRFYAVTNATTFTNAIFAIFSAPTLSIARNIDDPYAVSQLIGPNSQLPLGRNIESDLDLFVSTNSTLTNLDDLVVAGAWKSVDRLSDEMIVLTNSVPGTVYYIGVKSEDQQAGEFSLSVEFLSNNPLELNPDGSFTVEFNGADVPDGAPDSPKAALLPPRPGPPQKFPIAAVIVQDQYTSGNFGDLTGLLTHSVNNRNVFLNNHARFIQGQENGTVANTYDDIDYLTNPPPNVTVTDGPGGLGDYVGDSGAGSWRYIMIDNSPDFGGGHVDGAVVTLYPQVTNAFFGTSGKLFGGTVKAGQTLYGSLTVPATAVSLTLKVVLPNAGEGPVEMYVRRDNGSIPRLPGPSNYDYKKTIKYPGASLTIGRGDLPPLIAGNYIVGIYNPGSPTTTFEVFFDMNLDYGATAADKLDTTNMVVVADQVFTNSLESTINVNLRTNQIVSDIRVGVRIDHPRVSDLVLHLISPEGTAVLLSENRGHLNTNGFGLGTKAGEFAYTSFSEDTTVAPFPIKFASNSNFLEFIPPVLVATNFLEDTTNEPPVRRAVGTASEDRNFVITGTNVGSITIGYDFLTIPDRMEVYYDGVVIFDTGLVSGTGTNTIFYGPGLSDYLEIVMNEGTGTNTTIWNYSYTLDPAPPLTTNKTQRATGAWIVNNDLYVSGLTAASATNGILARFGIPMQDNALPIWEVNWPDLKGATKLNGVAATTESVFVAGDNYTMTSDNQSDGAKQTKGITASFPAVAPFVNTTDVYGSLWHTQTPGFTNVDGYEQLHGITTVVENGTNVIYVTGDAQSDPINYGRLYVAKLETNGVVDWTTNDLNAAVTTNYSSGRAITTLNGSIYVAGANADSGITNAYLVKLDPNGSIVWANASSNISEFRGIAAYGNAIYTVGYAVDAVGITNCLVQKWDESGGIIWSNQFSINGVEDILNSVVGYGDRLYAVGSTLLPLGPQRDALLLEIRQDTGALVTSGTNYIGITTYDGGGAGDDIATGVVTDGFDLYVVGEMHRLDRPDNDFMVLRYRIKNDYLPEEPLSMFVGEFANSIISGTNTNGWRLVIWDNRADSTPSVGTLLSWQLQLTLAPTNHTPDILVHDVQFYATASPANSSRYFIVNVPYTANTATIAVTNLAGDAMEVYMRQDGLPLDTNAFDVYHKLSLVPDGTFAVDTTTTFPVLLPGQRFYVRVDSTSDFTIQVTFDSNATTYTAAGGSSTPGSFGAGTPAEKKLYQFSVKPASLKTAFQVKDLTGPVDVYLRRGNTPTDSAYDLHQVFSGTNFGQFIIQANGSMTNVTGTWFATVGKLTTSAVTYNIVITNLDSNQSPIIGVLNDQSVAKGDSLSFTVSATDPDAGQQLTYSLDSGAPSGASINPTNGVFSWTPTAAQGPSTNVVTIRVTDNGTPQLSAAKTIHIFVTEKVPVLGNPTMVSGQLQITWTSVAGQSYEVQTSTNLVQWTKVSTNAASGSTTTYLDPQPTAGNVDKFYRVRLLP